MEEEWNIRRGGSIGESARVKERQTRRWSSPSPCARGATARLPRPRKVSPVTFNFRAVGKSPPLELGHRPADSPPPPPAILPYHDDGPSFSPPFPLPRLNFRLVSRFASFEFPNACIRDFSHFFFLPLGHTIDKREEMGRKRFRVFSYTSPSRAEGVDATSLSLVVHGRKFKFRDGGETGEEPGSIRRERTLLYLSMRSDRSTPTTNSWDRSSVLERLHLDRSNRGSRHRDNS